MKTKYDDKDEVGRQQRRSTTVKMTTTTEYDDEDEVRRQRRSTTTTKTKYDDKAKYDNDKGDNDDKIR